MKKLISTQGYTDGHYEVPNLNAAISERVDNRLTACYRQYYGDDIHIAPALTYQVTDGQVTMIQLTYAIDNPTPERLENFREACDLFYELHRKHLPESRASSVPSMQRSHLPTPSSRPQAPTYCKSPTFPTIASPKERSSYPPRQPATAPSCRHSTSPPICTSTTIRSPSTRSN